MMLRINWTQVRGLKEHLARQGFLPDSDILAMILYKSAEPSKLKIKFEKLQEFLFDLDGDANVVGIFLFDTTINKPLWSAKAAERQEALETIPVSGHPTVITEFKNMNAEQKQVWIDITVASIQSALNKEI